MKFLSSIFLPFVISAADDSFCVQKKKELAESNRLTFVVKKYDELKNEAKFDHLWKTREDQQDAPKKYEEDLPFPVVGMFAIALSTLLTWATKRYVPWIDSNVAIMVCGMLYSGIFVGTDAATRARDLVYSGTTDVLTAPQVFGGMLGMNTRMASTLAPQYSIQAFLGSFIISVLGGLSIFGLSYSLSSKTGFANDFSLNTCVLYISIAALLCSFNTGPISKPMSFLGVGQRVVMLMKGEGMAMGIMMTFLSKLKDYVIGTPVEVFAGFIKETVCAFAIGSFMAAIFLIGIERMSNRYRVYERQLQIIACFLCSYATFYVAKAMFNSDGPQAGTVAGYVMAWRMWASITAKDEMKQFWAVVTFCCDTCNTFIMGSLLGGIFVHAGKSMIGKDRQVFLSLLVLIFGSWLIVTVVRIFTLFLLRPLISRAGRPVSVSDTMVWAWAGTVKGKLGLALTIYSATSKMAGEKDNELKVLVVGGVTFISLIVNSSLITVVMKLVGRAKQSSTAIIKSSLSKRIISRKLEDVAVESGNLFTSTRCPEVVNLLSESNEDISELRNMEFSKYKLAVRDIFMDAVVSFYWKRSEGEKPKNVRLIVGYLIESTYYAKDHLNSKLTDWNFLRVSLPDTLREVAFVLYVFMKGHQYAREVLDSIFEERGGSGTGGELVMKNCLRAWESVRKESARAERVVGRVLERIAPPGWLEGSVGDEDSRKALELIEAEIIRLNKWGIVSGTDKYIAAIESDASILVTRAKQQFAVTTDMLPKETAMAAVTFDNQHGRFNSVVREVAEMAEREESDDEDDDENEY